MRKQKRTTLTASSDIMKLSSSSAVGTLTRPLAPISSAARGTSVGLRSAQTSLALPAVVRAPFLPAARTSGLVTYVVQNRERWNAFVATMPGASILQSYEWGEFKSCFGWQAHHLLVEDQGVPVAGAQILLRPTPFGTFAYVPHGPLVDWDKTGYVYQMLKSLHRYLRRKLAFCVKIEPAQLNNPDFARALLSYGFRSADTIQPRSTIIVDLQENLDRITARIDSKMRYNMRLAQRRGITCHEGTAADIPVFYRLMEATSQRAGFALHSLDYYKRVWECLEQRGLAQLLFAVKDEEVLAATMLFVLGDRAYSMYSGSSDLHRNLKPNDYLQLESIRWAKSIGCTSYDLWGIPDEIGRRAEVGESIATEDLPAQQHGELWGVYQFKRNLGGDIVRFAGAFDYIYNPLVYWLWNRALPRVRELKQSLRKRTEAHIAPTE